MGGQQRTKTDGDAWALTPQQCTAIDLLVSGTTITEAAATLDVRRQTISEWVNHHPGFQSQLNARRQEIWQGAGDRLRGLIPRALEVLARELEGEQSLAAAVHVLKSVGLYGSLQPPHGPIEPEDAEIAQRQAEYARMLRSMAAGA